MDVMESGAIGELAGGVAVIASLIYVGLQVRQSNNLAQGAAELEMGRMTMDYARLGAEGENATIYSLAVFEPDALSEDQRQRALWAFGMWLHMAQAMFRQFLAISITWVIFVRVRVPSAPPQPPDLNRHF